MSELDPRSLWQDQPTDDLAVHPEKAGRAVVDYAVPTTQFAKPPRRAGFGVIGAVAALAAVVVVSVGVALRPPAPARLAPQVVAAADPVEELEALLVECRTWANPEASQPDWDRAEAACSRALDLEPIHHEALAAIARIRLLRTCEANLKDATAQAEAGRLESALVAVEKLDKACELYLLRAMPLARTAAQEVQRTAATDCRRYASAKKWDLALPRCELYSRLACQSVSLSRETDPLFAWLLEARANRQPGLSAWLCPSIDVLRPPAAPPNPTVYAKDRLMKRYAEPELGRALVRYFEGDSAQARVGLQKVIERMSKAASHEQARALLLDLDEAAALVTKGTSLVHAGKLEEAAVAFHRALELDARLMLGADFKGEAEARRKELARMTSVSRRLAVELMSQSAYTRGRDLADRKDYRAACRVWKVGHEFSRSSLDLLKALTNICTRKAGEAFDRAQTCEQLLGARDFAVDGDGFKERIDASLQAEGCR